MKFAPACVAAVITSLLAAPAGAQVPSPTGNVYGTALDEQGSPIAAATATLAGPDASRTTTTGTHGDFRFLALAPGSYALELSRSGLRSVKRGIEVQLGRSAVVEMTMSVAGAEEAVTVRSETPAFDTREVVTGAVYGAQELRDVPTVRDVGAILRQVPGVLLDNTDTGSVETGNAHGAARPAFVGKGAPANQNTFSLEGTSISIDGLSPVLLDFDSLESISVWTGGSDPSLPSPGATVNLVTKRGTNQVAGSARALYADGSQWDYGLEAGGPLWKDRVWIWGAAASNSYLGQTFFLPSGEPTRSQETDRYFNAKLTAQPAPANTLTLAFLDFQRSVDGRGANPQRSEPTTQDVHWPGASYKIEDSQVLSEKLFATLSFASVTVHRTATPKGGLAEQADFDADYVWQHSYTSEYTERPQRDAGITASAFFDTGALRHELKFGFGYRHAHIESASSWPGDALVGYAAPQPAQAAVTRAMNAKLEDNFYDTYLSDTIQLADLTVNLGARFDYQQSRNLPSSVPANPAFPELLPAVRYGGDSGYPITWRSVEPRIGVTWAVGADRRTLLRASYARFADELGTDVAFVNAFPGIAQLYYNWNDANGNGRVEPSEINLGQLVSWSYVDPNNPGSATPVNALAAGLKAPTTDEFIVGIDRQISPDLSASLAYTYRRRQGTLFSPLIGTTRASYAYEGNASGTVRDPATGFVLEFSEPYYELTTKPVPDGSVLQNRPDTTQTYGGFQLQVLKSFSDNWMLRVAFAYNDSRQQVGAGGIIDPNNVIPGVNTSGPLVDGGIECQQGLQDCLNAKWQFNVSGVVRLPLGIQAGVNFFGRQGFPIIYFVQAETHDTAGSAPLLQIGSPTDYRTPNVYQLDLQLTRDFLFGSRVTVTPSIACFNLIGSRTVLARDGFVGDYDLMNLPNSPAFNPNTGEGGSFNAVIEAMSGRTIRGGVRISF
ncbi:MAG TPA: TonB-dependent receptor [Thermoanaerobaculia bacterium]|nr:TonB-dependent receptor [Thermoanaerobaculia bacterium]